MIPISGRYFVPLLAMLLLTAIPVTAHYIVGLENDDCADPGSLPRLAINGARNVSEWSDHYDYATTQFTRGEVRGSKFLWVRSKIPQPFYLARPFLTPGFFSNGPSTLERVQVDGIEVPIRVWQEKVMGEVHVTAILKIYRGRPVESVVEPSLRNAMETMLHGPRPVDFIGIVGAAPAPLADKTRQTLVNWVAGTWTHYLRTCEPK